MLCGRGSKHARITFVSHTRIGGTFFSHLRFELSLTHNAFFGIKLIKYISGPFFPRRVPQVEKKRTGRVPQKKIRRGPTQSLLNKSAKSQVPRVGFYLTCWCCFSRDALRHFVFVPFGEGRRQLRGRRRNLRAAGLSISYFSRIRPLTL